jgi:hypothetical protein
MPPRSASTTQEVGIPVAVVDVADPDVEVVSLCEAW